MPAIAGFGAAAAALPNLAAELKKLLNFVTICGTDFWLSAELL